MPAAAFDPAAFKTRYSQFAPVDNSTLAAFDVEAGFYMPAESLTAHYSTEHLRVLQNMLVAHIAELSGVLAADGMPRPVGQITAAGEGSVNASFQAEPGSGEWFKQTQAGAAFWRAVAPLRCFLYVPGC